MGYIKGVGKIYRQTFIDTYAKVATVKLYDRKIALVVADMLNDRVISMYDQYGILLMRILTDRGTEYCGAREHHEFQLYLAIEDIDHTKTKAKSPQTNGICERFHRTMQDEFYLPKYDYAKYYESARKMQICGTFQSLILVPRFPHREYALKYPFFLSNRKKKSLIMSDYQGFA